MRCSLGMQLSQPGSGLTCPLPFVVRGERGLTAPQGLGLCQLRATNHRAMVRSNGPPPTSCFAPAQSASTAVYFSQVGHCLFSATSRQCGHILRGIDSEANDLLRAVTPSCGRHPIRTPACSQALLLRSLRIQDHETSDARPMMSRGAYQTGGRANRRESIGVGRSPMYGNPLPCPGVLTPVKWASASERLWKSERTQEELT